MTEANDPTTKNESLEVGETSEPAVTSKGAATREASEPSKSSEQTALEREVLRINLRFNTEVIEAQHVCPFARAARLDGSSVRRVLPITSPDIDAVIEVIAALEREDSPEVAVGQIIFPRLDLGPKEYSEFISDVGRANSARFAPKRPVFVYAAFHPALTYATDTPPRLVPFFRRSPDPLMQVVRLSVLDAIHSARPSGSAFWDGSAESLALLMAPRPESVTDRITRENHAAALAGSLETISAIHKDISEDRARSYAALTGQTTSSSTRNDGD